MVDARVGIVSGIVAALLMAGSWSGAPAFAETTDDVYSADDQPVMLFRKNYAKYLHRKKKIEERKRKSDAKLSREARDLELGEIKSEEEALESQRLILVRESARIEQLQNKESEHLTSLMKEHDSLKQVQREQIKKYSALYDDAKGVARKKKFEFWKKNPQEVVDADNAMKEVQKLKKEHEKMDEAILKSQSKVSKYSAQQEQLEKSLKPVEEEIKRYEKEISTLTLDNKVLTMIEQKNISMNGNEQYLLAKQTADEVLDRQKQNHYDSKLLLTNMEVLQTKNKLSKLEIDALRDSLDGHLNGTLMGDYVNEQIKKAMSNVCALQAACAVKDAGAMNSIVDDLLKSPRGTRLEFVNGKMEKSVPDVKGGTGQTLKPGAGAAQ